MMMEVMRMAWHHMLPRVSSRQHNGGVSMAYREYVKAGVANQRRMAKASCVIMQLMSRKWPCLLSHLTPLAVTLSL